MNIRNKNAFQYDTYRPLQWSSLQEKEVSARGVCPGGVYPGGVFSTGGVCLGVWAGVRPLDPEAATPPPRLKGRHSLPLYMLGYTHAPANCIMGYTRPTVNRMTDRCKNITSPQTSFAGVKNEQPHSMFFLFPCGFLMFEKIIPQFLW